MYLSTNEERESGSMYEEVYDGHSLSKLNLCDEVSGKRRRKQDQCCSLLNSLSAIKYAILSLYILVLLTIFGLCLAAFFSQNHLDIICYHVLDAIQMDATLTAFLGSGI
ncbi:Scavenger receptor class A member 5 [Xenotaenia resolanae]|uniref:Scavenger receptor class A member 5 n=1 Tax=Xenotaenia resolanae TaxID=208358 RepID=A0ABV0W396_9TELE